MFLRHKKRNRTWGTDTNVLIPPTVVMLSPVSPAQLSEELCSSFLQAKGSVSNTPGKLVLPFYWHMGALPIPSCLPPPH